MILAPTKTSERISCTGQGRVNTGRVWVGLYTISQSAVLYGVRQTKGGVGWGVIYCALVCALVAQEYCNSVSAMQMEGGNKRMIDSCTHKNK